MAVELWLVRHGQAAFGTDDYDRLTDLGWQQARWLAGHLQAQGHSFARIAAGTLRRQQETAQALAETLGGDVEVIPGFEEYDADALIRSTGSAKGPRLPRREHFQRLRTAMSDWARGGLPEMPETWDAFGERTRAAVDTLIGKGQGPVLAASSGGAIAMIVAQTLGLAPERMIELNLQARNTAITRLIFTGRTTYLNMFNAVPHLEHPTRRDFETYS